MKQLYYCRIANIKSGLCNQLFALINGIILAERKKSKIVILGLFLNDYSRNNVTPISQIIDLPKFNMFVLQNYGIHIMDKTDTKLSIHNVTYGTQDHHIDITQFVIDKFYKNNIFLINTNINLNLLAGNDPSPGKVKYIEITYSLTAFTKSCTFFAFTKSCGKPKSKLERVFTSTIAKMLSFCAIMSISAF